MGAVCNSSIFELVLCILEILQHCWTTHSGTLVGVGSKQSVLAVFKLGPVRGWGYVACTAKACHYLQFQAQTTEVHRFLASLLHTLSTSLTTALHTKVTKTFCDIQQLASNSVWAENDCTAFINFVVILDVTWDYVPGSSRFSILQATKTWAGTWEQGYLWAQEMYFLSFECNELDGK